MFGFRRPSTRDERPVPGKLSGPRSVVYASLAKPGGRIHRSRAQDWSARGSGCAWTSSPYLTLARYITPRWGAAEGAPFPSGGPSALSAASSPIAQDPTSGEDDALRSSLEGSREGIEEADEEEEEEEEDEEEEGCDMWRFSFLPR